MRYILFCIVFLFSSLHAMAQGWSWGTAASKGGQEGYTVAADPYGNVYTAFWNESIDDTMSFGGGVTLSVTSDEVVWVKYDGTGTALWAGKVTGAAYLHNICSDPSGDLIVFGSFTGVIHIGSFTLTNSSGGCQYFLTKISPSGTVLWAINDGNIITDGYLLISSAEIMSEGAVTTDAGGNIYITSSFAALTTHIGTSTLTNNGANDIFVAKYSPAGVPLWANSLGGADDDYGLGIAVAATGDVYVSGAYFSTSFAAGSVMLRNFTSHPYAFIARFNSAGVPVWGQGEGGVHGAFAVGLTSDNYGNVYMTGGFCDSSISFGDTTIHRTYPGTVPNDALFLVQYSPGNTVTWHKTIGSASGAVWGFCTAMASCGQVWVSGNYTSDLNLDGETLSVVSGMDPVFIAGYNIHGTVAGFAGLGSGGDDQNGMACDPYGNVYISSDFENAPFVVGPDVLNPAGGPEYFYLAKYSNTGSVPDSASVARDTAACGIAGVTGVRLAAPSGFYNYFWDNGSTDSTRIVTAPGTYYVFDISCGLTVRIDTFHVTFLPPVDSINIFHDTTVCGIFGDSLLAPGGYASYLWSTGSFDPAIYVTGAGAYFLKGIRSSLAGCQLLVDTFHITFSPVGDTTYTHQDTGACYSVGYATLRGGGGYSRYSWSTGSTDDSLVVFIPGTYILREQSPSCNLVVDTFHFSIIPDDTSFAESDSTVCPPVSHITLRSPGGYLAYRWNTGSVAPSISVTMSGTYILYGLNGCSVLTDTFYADVNPGPSVNLGPDTSVCAGDSLVLSSAGSGRHEFLWNTGSTDSSISISGAGAYWLRETNSAGCMNSDTIHISLAHLPSAGFITGSDSICERNTTFLTESVSGGAWSAINTSATVTGGIVTGMAPGVDTIIYTVTNSCGPAFAYFPVYICSEINAASDGYLCPGSTRVLSDSTSGGYWTSNNTRVATVGSESGLVTGVSAGTVIISYVFGSGYVSDTLTVYAQPVAGAISGVDTLCPGDSVTLSSTSPGGNWYSANYSIAGINSSGVVKGIMPGADYIIYIVRNECGTAIDSVTITVKNCPSGVTTQLVPGYKVTITPNPVSNDMLLNADPELYSSFTIYNAVGQLMMRQPIIATSSTINAQGLPGGLYYICVTGNGLTVLKFIKM